MTGQAVGTPAYMSPEQAAGELEALGPASDVYSLGATLYFLLTDRPPFAGEPAQVLQDVQRGRFVGPQTVQPRVPRALDAICRKAMAAQPEKRYGWALALAEDLERWLADEPVSAWREPWTARARRWTHRHLPIVAGAAATVIVAIVALGLAVPLLSIAWRKEADARQAAQGQRIVAIQQAEQAEQALNFLMQAFRKPHPAADGRSLKVVDLLDRAAADLDRSLSDRPQDQATLWNVLGKTFLGLGLPRESIGVFQRALETRRRLLGENHPDTLNSYHHLAMAYQDAGRYDQAIPILETTLARLHATLGADHSQTLQSMNNLAWAYWKAGRPREAIPLYEVALAGIRAQRGADHLETLTITDNLAVAYASAGQPERAIPLHEHVLARLQAKLGADHATTLITMNNLARAYQASHRLDEAVRLRETTVAKLHDKMGPDHPTTLTAKNGLAEAYRDTGKIDQAAELLHTVLTHRRTRLGEDHPDTLLTTFTLAQLEFDRRRPESAIPLARVFLDRAEKIEGRLPAKVRDAIPRAAGFLAEHYRRAGQPDLAETFRKLQQRRPSTPGAAPEPPDTPANAPVPNK
jgi:serine/threonine-protein kinase